MLRLSFKSSKGRAEILGEAEKFFGDMGLWSKEKSLSHVLMEGGGGYVRVNVVGNERSEVILETREWEYPS